MEISTKRLNKSSLFQNDGHTNEPLDQRAHLNAQLTEYWPMMNRYKCSCIIIEALTMGAILCLCVYMVMFRINKQLILHCCKNFDYCLEFMVPSVIRCTIDDEFGVTGDHQILTSTCSNNLLQAYRQIIFAKFWYFALVLIMIFFYLGLFIMTTLCSGPRR